MKTKLCWIIIYISAFLVVNIQSGFKFNNIKNLLQAIKQIIKGKYDNETNIKKNNT